MEQTLTFFILSLALPSFLAFEGILLVFCLL